jgi:hypothetical protein
VRPESRTKFERLGIDYVRKDIGFGFTIQDGEETREAQEWMFEQNRRLEMRESLRFWAMLLFTVIAAVGAVIAAIPVIKDWLK